MTGVAPKCIFRHAASHCTTLSTSGTFDNNAVQSAGFIGETDAKGTVALIGRAFTKVPVMDPPFIWKVLQVAIGTCGNKTGGNNVSLGMTVSTAAVCHIAKPPVRHQSPAIGIRAEMIVWKAECGDIRGHVIILGIGYIRFFETRNFQQFFEIWLVQNRAVVFPVIGACHNDRIIRHIYNRTIAECGD